MSTASILVVALAMAAGVNSAWAINKCISADGKTVYQEHACSTGSKTQEIKIEPSAKELDERWSFTRSKDEMTGRQTCFMSSPVASMLSREARITFAKVYVQWAAPAAGSDGAFSFSARSFELKDDLFHTDISGTGLKVDEQAFVPFTARAGKSSLGFANAAAPELMGQMQNGKSFRLRLRFWPYDALLDSPDISLAGFSQAAQQFLRCARP